MHAPQLNGVYGGPVQLSDGRTVVADDAYIRDSILQPGKDIVAGFKNEMPNFAGLIDDSEILRLTAYIRSLASRPANKQRETAMADITIGRTEPAPRPMPAPAHSYLDTVASGPG